MSLVQKFVSSPVGRLRLVATDRALVGVYFSSHRPEPRPDIEALDVTDVTDVTDVAKHAVLDRAARELDEYFAGRRRTFSTPLERGGTDFQRAVWSELSAIPFGEHRSYRDIAARIGSPRAVRAVGSANARNPLSIFVPCHRVVGSSGTLSGYAGGVSTKQWLLEHESRRAQGGGGR